MFVTSELELLELAMTPPPNLVSRIHLSWVVFGLQMHGIDGLGSDSESIFSLKVGRYNLQQLDGGSGTGASASVLY